MEEIQKEEKLNQPEIFELKARLEKLEKKIEQEKIVENKEAIIKQEIKNYLEDLQKSPSFAAPVKTRDETEEIQKMEPDQQVGALISLVFEKGLLQAISLAQSLNNPAILDEFHDTLVDYYFELMVKKGIIEL